MASKEITTASQLQQALLNREVEMPEFTMKDNMTRVYAAKLSGYHLKFPYMRGVEEHWISAEISWDLALRIYQGKTKQVLL